MLRRITRKLAILAVLAGMLSGLAPSMLAVRTAHADEASQSGASTALDRSSAPAPKRSEAAESEPLTAADLQVRSAVVPSDALASGTAGTCLFYITSDLQMVITPADGAHGILPNLYASKDWPWYRYAAYIKTIRFDRGVKTGDSLNWAFSNGSADADAYNRLESVDFTNLDAADLTQMYGILAYDRTLTEVNMNMLNAVQVTSMAEAFRSTGITGLDLTAIGDGKLVDVGALCLSCHNLQAVTTGWTMRNVTAAWNMFNDCFNLTQIDAQNWRFGHAGNLSLMFNGCSSLKTLDVSRWNVGSVFNLYHTFGNCTGLTTLDVSTWDTGSLTDARGLFYHCTGLKTLDVSDWNTGKVTSFENIFAYCTSLTKLDVSGWNTGKATSMSGMFDHDGKLTVLDVSRWDTSNVQAMTGMFRGTGISTLDVSRWNVSHVGNIAEMFHDCVNLVTLDTSRWRLDSAWGAWSMFYNCVSLTGLDVTHWGMGHVGSMATMFYHCHRLTGLNGLAEWDTGNATTLDHMFTECGRLSTVGITSWNVRKVTTTKGMLQGTPITSLDLSAWNTDSLTNMQYMFENCTKLTSLDLSGWNTSNVTDVSGLFGHDQQLANLRLDGWNTGNVRLMGHMFEYCTKLTSLDLSGWDTSNVTDMYALFDNCTSLASLKLGDRWNMGNVTDTTWMFSGDRKLASAIARIVPDWNMGSVRKTAGMFSDCVDGVLDLSKWNTPLLTDTRNMFRYNPNLTRILVNENWSNVTFMDSSAYMFTGCTRLVGDDGKGLAYDSSKTDGAQAMPGTGYMTLKAAGGKTMHTVTYMDWNGNVITTRRVKDGMSGESIGMHDTTWLADPDMNFNADRWGGCSFTEKGKKQSSRDCYANAVDWPVAKNDTLHVTGKADYTRANEGGILGWRAYSTASGTNSWDGYFCRKGASCLADRYYTFGSAVNILPFTQIGLWDDYGTAIVSTMQLTQVDPVTHRSLARDGYAFTGWSEDISNVTGDMTVQAQYKPVRYTVNYDANGGTGSMPASTLTYDRPQALPAIGFTKAGYSFAGWNTQKDGSGKTFTDKQIVGNLLTHENAAGTLYAQWTPTPPVITVIFHSNDGGADETVKRVWASNNLDMKAIGLPDGWTRRGFVFHGWNLAADGSGVEYKAGESLYGRMTTATVDLYADWAGLQSTLPQAGGSTKAPAYGAGLSLMILGAGVWLASVRRRRMA